VLRLFFLCSLGCLGSMVLYLWFLSSPRFFSGAIFLGVLHTPYLLYISLSYVTLMHLTPTRFFYCTCSCCGAGFDQDCRTYLHVFPLCCVTFQLFFSRGSNFPSVKRIYCLVCLIPPGGACPGSFDSPLFSILRSGA